MTSEGLPEQGSSLPSFPERAIQVFVSPGELADRLAERPAWAAALVAGLVLVLLQVGLIPAEIWEASFRRVLLEQGQDVQNVEIGAGLMRVSGLVGGAVGWTVMTFVMAGLVTGVFAFVLGDEGRFTQYLAVLSHAWLIPALVGLALVPLRIAQSDPQLVLSVGTFFFFLPEGYFLSVLGYLDLSQLWAMLVLAQGAHAIDPRRSFGSAAAILLGVQLAMALLLAALVPG